MSRPLPIAIVGAACRMPGADGLDAFAELLLAGRDAVGTVPAARWTAQRFLHPLPGQPGKTYNFAAGCLPTIDRFDAAFFGISAREALSIDPQQRLLLELAYEASEDAGMPLAQLAGSPAGVYIGGSSWDFAAGSFTDVAALDAYSMQGGALSSLANRISYVFDLRGPSLTVDTACSSSLVALHMACEAIRHGEIPLALVGGVNLLQSPQSFVGFARASMLSRLGRCHSFDARADGYVRAEGGGVVLLKPLAQAQADGDEIRAVIVASGVNSDGRTNGFSLPNGAAQAALLRRIYDEADIAPEDLGYFEAHGTGTPVGDPIEARAIGEALGQRRTSPLPLGSVKTNVGHLEPASFMAGLMKLLVAFEHRTIPPSLHFAQPNPNIAFTALNLEIVAAARPLRAGTEGVMAAINSFGFGGTNAHAVLAAPPERPAPVEAPGGMAPLLLSARSEAALRGLAEAWRTPLASEPPARLAALLRGQARRREQHPHRLAIVPAAPAVMAQRLDGWLANGAVVPGEGVTSGLAQPGGLAFVFSGNGSQWAGMGRDALRAHPPFAAALAEVDAVLAGALGWSVIRRLESDDLQTALRHTEVAQPLLFAIQVAIVGALRAEGVVASAHVGHSAGEVAAAWASGALSLGDACTVIVRRSLAQQHTHGTGGMAALGLGEAQASAWLARHAPGVVVAAVNSARAVTLAGDSAALDRLRPIAEATGLAFVRLDLDYAFHSAAMDPIRAALLTALAGLRSSAPRQLLVSTVSGEAVDAGLLDAEYWWRNVREPVRFEAAIRALLAAGLRHFVEIGPAPVLQGFLREALQEAKLAGHVFTSLSRRKSDRASFASLAAACHVAGASIAGGAGCDGPALIRALPRYPWQRQVVPPARSGEAVELLHPVFEHPLLGFRDPASTDRWTAHLGLASEPWLAEHRLDGAAVLPAAAMIDMAFAAAHARHPEAGVLEIQDLDISRPLMFEESGARECRTTLAAEGQFELASRPRLSGEAFLTHASGRLLPGLSDGAILAPLDATCETGVIEAATVYAIAERLHLHYGPAFRSLVEVRRQGATRASAMLRADASERAGFLLDPTLLDGSFQALLALVLEPPETGRRGAMVPWRFGRIRLLRTPAARAWLGPPRRAALHVRAVGPHSLSADIALHDAAGGLVAELIGCWFATLPTARGAAPEQRFWTAYVPSARQPRSLDADPVGRVMAACPAVEETAESVLLADAFLTAAAVEALRERPTALVQPGSALHVAARGWLAEDGYAVHDADGWRLGPAADLPASARIWRSLFFDVPQAGAECALLAGFGAALAARDEASPQLSAVLREQILFASPSGHAAIEALLQAVDTLAAHWAAGRALRIAVVGSLHAPLLRRLVATVQAREIPLRIVLFADADEAFASVQPVLEQTAGMLTRHWGACAEEDAGGFEIVLGLYALTLGSSAALLARLLAPGGLLLCAEPAASRMAALIFTPPAEAAVGARLQAPAHWCAALRDAGLATTRQIPLGGELWPVALLLAEAAAEPAPSPAPRGDAEEWLVFAAPDDALADALAARHSRLRRLPIETMQDTLAAPSPARLRHLLVLVPTLGEEDARAGMLAELLAGVAAALLGGGLAGTTHCWLVSRGAPFAAEGAAALGGLRRVLANEAPERDCRSLCLDAALPVAAAAEWLEAELAEPDAEREIYRNADSARLVPRLRRHLPPAASRSGPRRLAVGRLGLIASLGWQPLIPRAPAAGEVAISVRAAALNFRDVMWAQGLLPDEALLDGFSGPSLGIECAGVVSAVGEGVVDLAPGDRVMAVAPAALASETVTRRNGVIRIPDGLDFAAAATMPVVFMTAVHALGHLARLQPGERVLIHGGGGGVGLAAIQYALHKGAIVYATAGSPMRRQTLRMLGVSGVFDSRSAAFADEILAATGGEGVDVVLNSLNGELMQQTLRLLRPFGRFLEIGKRDLYRNTAVGLRALRHNAAYFAVDIDELMAHRPAQGQAVLAELMALLEAGQLQPIPYRGFGFADVVDAFRLLQSSGHLGKVVLLAEPTPMETVAGFAADPNGCYVVSGGLSGFGLEAARWLARQGARRLALLGRRGARTPGAAQALAGFAQSGVHAEAFACDIADAAEVARVLARIRAEGAAIRGVLHAAMVLDDARLADLTAARFAAVIAPKLAGAAVLDRLTRQDPLDLFVLFSSVTTVIGTPGQANYVAANAALEALAVRRHAAGLPALAVQWGPIGDAGYLLRAGRVSEMLAKLLGTAHLAAAQALAALPELLAAGQPVVGLADIAWGEVRARLPGLAAPFWSEMPTSGRGDASAESVRARLAALPADAATLFLRDLLAEELAAILKQAPASIDPARPILDFGVDSLMAVELRTALEARLGITLPLLSLSPSTTLAVMAERLLPGLREGDNEVADADAGLLATLARHEGAPPGDALDAVAAAQ